MRGGAFGVGGGPGAGLAGLASQNSSPRPIRVLAESRRQLSPWNASPEVTGLDERLRGLGLTA